MRIGFIGVRLEAQYSTNAAPQPAAQPTAASQLKPKPTSTPRAKPAVAKPVIKKPAVKITRKIVAPRPKISVPVKAFTPPVAAHRVLHHPITRRPIVHRAPRVEYSPPRRVRLAPRIKRTVRPRPHPKPRPKPVPHRAAPDAY